MKPLTTEQVKDILKAYRSLAPRIRSIKLSLDNFEHTATASDLYSQAVKRPTDGVPGSSGHGDKTASIAISMVQDMEALKKDQLKEKRVLEHAERQISNALSSLPEQQRLIVQEKYVIGKSWIDVLYTLGEKCYISSERTLQRKGDAGLQALTRLLVISTDDYNTVIQHLP